MFSITSTDFLLIDPILATELRQKVRNLMPTILHYNVNIECANNDVLVYVSIDNKNTDKIKCPINTKNKLLETYSKLFITT